MIAKRIDDELLAKNVEWTKARAAADKEVADAAAARAAQAAAAKVAAKWAVAEKTAAFKTVADSASKKAVEAKAGTDPRNPRHTRAIAGRRRGVLPKKRNSDSSVVYCNTP